MINSKIEWTDDTWNFIYGCTHVSEGCRNCYAEKVTHRFSGEGMKFEGLTVLGANGSPRFTGKILFDEKRLLIPLRKKKPTKYFVNSMSDLFHENVTFEQIDKAFAVMALSPQHTFQILTKRPERMREYMTDRQRIEEIRWNAVSLASERWADQHGASWPLPNVWLGVSVEDQKTADERIPILLDTPAAIRFISYEPALGAVDLGRWVFPQSVIDGYDEVMKRFNAPPDFQEVTRKAAPHLGRPVRLDWVIAGGESGPDARPSHPDWYRSLRDQCVAAGTAFFFKQHGEWQEGSHPTAKDVGAILLNGRYFTSTIEAIKEFSREEWYANKPTTVSRVGKKQSGSLLDGVEWNEYPTTKT